MKIKFLYAAICMFTVAVFIGCNNNRKKVQPISETSQTTVRPVERVERVENVYDSRRAMNYEGVYEGTLPCADCEGIRTELTLKGDTYKLKSTYLKNGKEESFTDSGKFKWENEDIIVLENSDYPDKYLVEDNRIFSLDMDGKKITGDLANMYILNKK